MDYFGEGDIVECIQANPRYGYVVGDRYTVQRSPGGGNWNYIPCPCGCGSGFTTDGPWAVQTFKLVRKAAASPSVGVGTAVMTAATGAQFQEGDFVECIKQLTPYCYVLGDRYRVERHPVSGAGFHVPCPCGSTAGLNTGEAVFPSIFRLAVPGFQQSRTNTGVPVALPAGALSVAPPVLTGSGAVYGYDLGGGDWSEERRLPVIRCECGSDKVGTPRHSDWCPKSHDSGRSGSW